MKMANFIQFIFYSLPIWILVLFVVAGWLPFYYCYFIFALNYLVQSGIIMSVTKIKNNKNNRNFCDYVAEISYVHTFL